MSDEERTTIALEHPIEFGKDRVIEELAFREIRMGDLSGLSLNKAVSELDVDTLLRVGAKLCGEPDQVLKKLRGNDAARVNMHVIGALGKLLDPGGESSQS